jgi:hypothetical protein
MVAYCKEEFHMKIFELKGLTFGALATQLVGLALIYKKL